MMKPEEDKALGASLKAHDPGLVGMQPQPERFQGRPNQRACLLGTFTGRAQDNNIIGIADQHPQEASVASPFLVEDVEHHVGQEGRDRRALRGTGFRTGNETPLDESRPKPRSQQFQHVPIRHPPLDLSDQGVVINIVETRFDINIQHPLTAPVGLDPDCLKGVMSRAFWSETETDRPEIGLENRFKDDLCCRHDHTITNSGNP